MLACIFLFAGCQKELSVENGFALGLATGSLKNDSGNCLPIAAKGTYVRDIALTDSNFVVIQVNFATAGNCRSRSSKNR